MVEFLSRIITDVLTSVYQSLGFSIMLAFFSMYLYLYAYDKECSGRGLKNAVMHWFLTFKISCRFRKVFLLLICIALILFRTLLNRNMWMNPLSDVIGVWGLYRTNPTTGELIFTTECVENTILFIPLGFMLVDVLKNSSHKKIMYSVFVASAFSFGIEFGQLLFRLGTFQLSDLFFNILGALIGSILWLICRLCKAIWINWRNR